MHYFSPVEKMELLEIITTEKTSNDTIGGVSNFNLEFFKGLYFILKITSICGASWP